MYLLGVSELHKFVNVALHTPSGEEDYDKDKLATLRIVGASFNALIYGLKGDITYEVFCERCRAVWQELERRPDLPQKIVSVHVHVFVSLMTAS